MEYYKDTYELMHHGIKSMKWGGGVGTTRR